VPPFVEFPDPAARLGPDVADPVAQLVQLVQQVRAGRRAPRLEALEPAVGRGALTAPVFSPHPAGQSGISQDLEGRGIMAHSAEQATADAGRLVAGPGHPFS
jgi:hypothetical protein